MSHNHNHEVNYGKAFAIGIVLNLSFIVIEVFYGLLANSSALIADAGHNASDVLGLVFAWFAIWMSKKITKRKYTYGYKKTTILISIVNALLLFGAVFYILIDAIAKFKNPEPVAGNQVMIVAAIGVVINTITALMFLKGQKHDLNIKAAFLHMAADAIVSLGVVISGLLIMKTGRLWIDPLMSLIIVIVILWSTWRLFTESVRLALDAVPRQIDIEQVENTILDINGVEGIHDLHVWAMSTTENAMSAHVKSSSIDTDSLLEIIRNKMHKDYNIDYVTVQIERHPNELHCESC
jgi:cobalt-zinc-cadmium efflux system protein